MAERIAVAYNDDAHLKGHLNETELLGEVEVIDTAREIADTIGAELVAVREDIPAALRQLQRFDVVVNLCEGVLGNPRLEKNFALALEMMGVAHTACDPVAVGICMDKIRVKGLLRAAGLPTPDVFSVAAAAPGRRGPSGRERPLPHHDALWMVKPSLEDAGIGIDATSVVATKDVASRVKEVESRYKQPALVEEFIDGRELNQALYCGTLLPPGEVVFGDELKPSERVVGWKAKWDSGSPEDRATVNRTPALIDEALKQKLAEVCSRAATLLGIDMYGRFDVRERGGELYVIDVNPNCDLGQGTGFRKALASARVSFPDFLNALIMAALARRSRHR